MSANPQEAGFKGGRSKSPAKIAAAKRNGFQKVATTPMSVDEYEQRKARTNEALRFYIDCLLQCAKEGSIDLDAVEGIHDGRLILKMLELERERRNGTLNEKASVEPAQKPSAEVQLFSEQKANV